MPIASISSSITRSPRSSHVADLSRKARSQPLPHPPRRASSGGCDPGHRKDEDRDRLAARHIQAAPRRHPRGAKAGLARSRGSVRQAFRRRRRIRIRMQAAYDTWQAEQNVDVSAIPTIRAAWARSGWGQLADILDLPCSRGLRDVNGATWLWVASQMPVEAFARPDDEMRFAEHEPNALMARFLRASLQILKAPPIVSSAADPERGSAKPKRSASFWRPGGSLNRIAMGSARARGEGGPGPCSSTKAPQRTGRSAGIRTAPSSCASAAMCPDMSPGLSRMGSSRSNRPSR